MGVTFNRAHAAESILRTRGDALPPGGMPSGDILDSWIRCTRAGLDAAHRAPQQVIEGGELARRRQRLEPVRRLALAEIETLHRQIAGSNFLLAFADADGIILDLFADNRFHMSGGDAPIVEGSCWSEEVSGTNGLGTALATGRTAAVSGLEHFFFQHGTISCAASPIRDAYGEIVGVLDASSYVESRQRHTQALVQMATVQIENLLLAQQMPEALVIAIHPRAEFLTTLSCGLIAFDAQGCISAVNARALGFLTGLDIQRGTPFERLFCEHFDAFWQRALASVDLRIRDVLGSTLAVRCIQGLRRRPSPHAESSPRLSSSHALRTAHTVGATKTALQAAAPSGADMVAFDPGVAQVVRLAEAASRRGMPMLIQGETGTGKELLARHVHRHSGRSGAFVAVNCAAVPAELFEAELFGYRGGAFTGARRDGSPGLIASAHGGTLLLDEIGDLPLALQAGLLRFLDDRQVRPVGGTQAREIDVLLLAATHVDLAAEVEARRFRADLFHRLNVVHLALPSLSKRSDFDAIARRLLHSIDPSATITAEALRWLGRQPWKGNMRELRSTLMRSLLLHADGHLAVADFSLDTPAHLCDGHPSALHRDVMQRVLDELARNAGSISRTARHLGVSRTTVYRYQRLAGATPRPAAPPQ